jgi:CheY-like chemotaxis protein
MADGIQPIQGHAAIGRFWREAITRASAAGARRTIHLHESHSSGELGYALCTVDVQMPGMDITVWDATMAARSRGQMAHRGRHFYPDAPSSLGVAAQPADRHRSPRGFTATVFIDKVGP